MYSRFHQIPGLAFFQFAWSLFKILSGHFFIFTQHPLKFLEFVHTKWSNIQNTQQNSTKFSAMLRDGKKMTKINFKFNTKKLNSA